MAEIEDIKLAMAALEKQRAALGGRVVDAALEVLRAELTALQASQLADGPHLKYVSVLFADIVGSTRMGRRLDPEDIMDIMDGALRRFNVLIEQHGGQVLRFMGDGLKAIFGAPLAHEDDAERAVYAGLAILEDARRYAGMVATQWGIGGFNVRVGVNTGQVILGGGVEAGKTAMGMAINLGARVESAAPPGGLLITQDTYQHVRGLFEVQEQPLLKVKGGEEPLQTYVVLKAKPRRQQKKRRGVAGVKTHMVGREAEMKVLRDAYRQMLAEGRTQVITVVGAAGMGKSRLLAEFNRWISRRPEEIALMRGAALVRTQDVPFGLLRDLCANFCQIEDNDHASVIGRKLVERLAAFFQREGAMKAQFIGALLGFDMPPSKALDGVREDPRQLRSRGLFYITRLFRRMAQKNPVVVFVDDLHWADGPSIKALQHLAKECADFPLLVLALARPELVAHYPVWEEESRWGEARRQRLEIHPLTPEDCHALVDDILRRAQPLTSELKRMLVKNAAGNPYYIEELVKTLIEDGVILPDEAGGAWQVRMEKLAGLHVPPTLTAVLQARLDALPLQEQRVLQRAAVVGMVFWDDTLQALGQSERPPEAEINSLAQREMVLPHLKTAFVRTREYAFKHAMLREVAYASVLKKDKKGYHARAAAWLVAVTSKSGRRGEYAATIAEHYARAGETPAAAGWYLRAGKRAKAQGAPQEANRLLDRAIELLPASERQMRWQALLERSEVSGVLGKSAARQADHAALLALADEFGDERYLAEAYYRIGLCAGVLGDERQALRAYNQSIEAAQRVGDARLEALGLALKVVSQTRLGDFDTARANAELALENAVRLDDDHVTARVLTNIAIYFTEAGDLARAAQLLRQQVEINRRRQDRLGESVGLTNLGYSYLCLGVYEPGRKVLEKSLAITEAIGARQQSAYNRLNLGLVYLRTGNFPAAHGTLKATLSDLQVIEDAYGMGAGKVYLAYTLEKSGDIPTAWENFSAAYQALKELGLRGFATDAQAGMARCLLAMGREAEAHQAGLQVWDELKHFEGRGLEFPALAYVTCAQIFRSQQETGECHAVLKAGFQNLAARANRISETSWRESFLRNIPEHRQLVILWRQIAGYPSQTGGKQHETGETI